MHLMLYNYLQLLSLLLALICYSGLSKFGLLAFIPMLIITNMIEILGINFRLFGWTNNYFLYNAWVLLTTPLYLFLYRKMLNLNTSERELFNILSLFILLLLLINFFFLQKPSRLNSYSLVLVEIVNIILSCLTLIRLVTQEKTEPHLFRHPYFWINTVNLLFSLSSFVLLGLHEYILQNNIQLNNKSLYFAILPAVNVILYLGYSYSFILCGIRQGKSF